jgi:hypothetical protein
MPAFEICHFRPESIVTNRCHNFLDLNFFFVCPSSKKSFRSNQQAYRVMDSDTLMTEAVIPERNCRIFTPLSMDMKAAAESLTTVLDRLPNASQDIELLHGFVENPENVDKSQILDCVARLMLRHELTLYIVKTFRPVVIDLVARWLTPRFLDFLMSTDNFNIVHKIESVAKAFSVILPIVPQTKR